MREVRSLEKRSIDSLVDQLLFTQMGGDLRIVGPNAALTPLDVRYVYRCAQTIVTGTDSRDSNRSPLYSKRRPYCHKPCHRVCLYTHLVCSLRAASFTGPFAQAQQLQTKYGELLNVTVQPTRYSALSLLRKWLLENAALEFGSLSKSHIDHHA
jgi:hypothetical protein